MTPVINGQKRKDSFGCLKKYMKFPETQEFIDKAYIEECCKENISVDDVVYSINSNCYFFLKLVMLLYGLLSNILFSFISYRLKIVVIKRNRKVGVEGIKKRTIGIDR